MSETSANAGAAAQSPASVANRADGGTWLNAATRRIRRPLAASAALTALLALSSIAQAWVLAAVLAPVALDRAAPRRLAWLALAFALLAMLRVAVSVGARRAAFGAAQTLARGLRAEVLRDAQALGPYGLRERASGDLITRLVDGIEAVLNYVARYLPQTASAVLVPVLILVCVFPADWISGLVLLLTAPLIPLFMALVGRAAGKASEQRYSQLTRLGAAFVEALGGLVTLRQLGAAERFAQRLDREGEQYRVLTMQVLKLAFLSSLALEFFATVSIAMVAILVGFRLLSGEMQLRQGLFVLLLAPEFYAPLRALGGLRHTRMDALAAARSLAAFGAEATNPPAAAVRGRSAILAGPPEIRIEGLSFGYRGRDAGLRDCAFSIAAGRVTALVGDTGSGKSTLIQLLLGFAAPEAGRILIDGVDLAGLDPAQWREQVAWVPQNTHVFEGSVRDNLALATESADESAMRRAAARSGFDEVVARLPRGWDTQLGERGLGLSGGQLQRLALTRALLRETARVWLLDEPTAHLDADSASRIDAIIAESAGSRTVLVVAHRLASARAADRVVVLRGGRVVEQGTPDELERAGGAYAALLEAEAS